MNILIIGRRGLGKSTLAVHEAFELNRNQIYFDPGDQFQRCGLLRAGPPMDARR